MRKPLKIISRAFLSITKKKTMDIERLLMLN